MKKNLRKIIQKAGFDFHRYYPAPDKMEYVKSLHIKTVLDIGANEGQFAEEIRKMFPGALIYSFEPLSGAFAILSRKFGNDKNFKMFHFALGDKNESVEMNKSSYSPSSSILQMSEIHETLFPHTKEHMSERIEIKKLDDIAGNLDLQKEILIKVDVQGFEDKVISGGQKTFPQAKAVIIETSFVELYKGQPMFDDIYTRLKNLGFLYHGSLQEKVHKKTGEIISEDSLFVR